MKKLLLGVLAMVATTAAIGANQGQPLEGYAYVEVKTDIYANSPLEVIVEGIPLAFTAHQKQTVLLSGHYDFSKKKVYIILYDADKREKKYAIDGAAMSGCGPLQQYTSYTLSGKIVADLSGYHIEPLGNALKCTATKMKTIPLKPRSGTQLEN